MIVVGGESLIDLIVHPDGRVVPAPGGGPYNVARTIARLGGHSAFLARLSTDRFGQLLRGHLEADGVDLSLAIPTDDPTTLALAELDAHGGASYRFYLTGTAAAGLTAAELPPMPIAALAAVHVGTLGLVLEPTGSALETFVTGLPEDVLVMLDPNCRPSATPDAAAYRARIDRLLRRADVVKVSTDDLAFLRPGTVPDAAAAELLALGPRVVLVTAGGDGVTAVNAAGTVALEVPTTTVVDTVGAGDSFGGGFLARWVAEGRGRGDLGDRAALESAARFAIRVAAITVSRAGADPPTLAEVEAAGG